jgi:hypothetical protein
VTSRTALFALVLASCARSTAEGDAAADAVSDAAPVVDVTPSDGAPDVPVTTAGPIDGAWQVTRIECDGAPASEAARGFITAPNTSSFSVRGGESVYALSTPACTIALASSVAYPSPGRAVFTATAPFRCVPAGCTTGCDTLPASPYVYDYTRGADDALTMRTVGPTPDVTCTANGQANPITYHYARRE